MVFATSTDHLHLLPPSLQKQVLKKRSERDALLKAFLARNEVDPDILSPRQVEITDIDEVDTLLSKLRSGDFSAYEVTEAYCLRALLAQKATNCLTEVLFERALRKAANLDQEFKASGKVVGPLHGLPISVKDAFDVEGVDSCIGYASRIGKPSEQDCEAVRVMENAGGIVFCKTNVPQALKWGETDNFIFGPTLNVDNPSLGPGGSSGGEGSLLRYHGSIAGWGTDIGGSVRMPASHCGLFTLRPTTHRFSNLGVTNSMEGLLALESTIGPMTRSISGCIDLAKVMIESAQSQRDAGVIDLGWRQEMFDAAKTRKLVIGVMEWDDVVMPHPPVRRAIAWAVEALRKAGHHIVPVTAYHHADGNKLFDQFMQLDRGSDHERSTEGSKEPIFPGNMREFQPNLEQLTGTEIMRLNAKRDLFRQNTLEHHATFGSIDCIICPVAAHAAPPHWKLDYYSYTKIWSLLDIPAGVVPVTQVNPDLDSVDSSYVPGNSQDRSNWDQYSPEKYARSPVGIQVAGKRYKEEELLGVMWTIAKCLDECHGTKRF